jgi:hypothetical protein
VKVRLLDAQAPLHEEQDPAAVPIAQLLEGQEFEVSGTMTQNGQKWARVALADGRQGYVPGATKIYQLREMRLTQDVSIYSEPSAHAHQLGQYPRGTLLLVLDKDDPFWIKVRTAEGVEGFIPQGSRMEDPRRAAAVAAVARRNMWVGGAWCARGIAVTAYTYSAASGSGTYVVAWGAIVFGGWQFLKGLLASLER